MIRVNLQDLNNIWVVYKRVSGKNYFVYSSRHVTTTYVNNANRYTNKAEAEECAKLWKEKQGSKFRVDALSKFMVNDFTCAYYPYNSKPEDKIEIRSHLISVDNVTKNKRKFNMDLDTHKGVVLSGLKNDISKEEMRIKDQDEYLRQAELRYQERIANANKQLLEDKVSITQTTVNAKDRIEQYNKLRELVEATDLNSLIEPFKTKTDNNMQVLFGKKQEETKEVTNHQMILLGK